MGEIPANGLKAPLAKEEEEEYDEAKFDDGEETEFLQPRAPTPSSVTEEDEDGYLKPNFHRFQSTEKGDDDGVPAPIPMISYGHSSAFNSSNDKQINNYLLYQCLCKASAKYGPANHSTNTVEVLKLDINFYITITGVHVHKKCK